MPNLSECIDCEKGADFLIVGAGGTLNEYGDAIKRFIADTKPLKIGINYMTGFCIPDYHLWTNKQRYRDFGGCINKESKMMFGCGLPKKLIRKHFKGDYILIDYVDSIRRAEENLPSVFYKDGIIYGCFRTAGCLAIVIAHLFGAKDIYVVGMDGFTLHPREELENQSRNHHCYAKGYTDDATWEQCIEKDRLVDENLNEIDTFGVKFKIITPTKFENFYDHQILKSKE